MREILEAAIRHFASLLIFLIFVRVILSWFPEPKSDSILRQLYFNLLRIAHILTDPITGPIRNLIRKSPLGGPGMVLDFSPIIALFLIQFARDILIQIVRMIF
ncbi:MAG: YggT family protein [Defluviitaleaceae bacterium]|nr:YggT family protein [Defluviitaleaceae bacterium]